VTTHDGVILVGGGGRRLGGVSKSALVVAGRSLLVHALDAMGGSERIIVVGAVTGAGLDALGTNVVVAREEPPGGGPVAGLEAGLALVEAPVVAVLAVDMPLVTRATIEELSAGCATREAVMLVDADGRRQPLAAAYRTSALRTAIARLDRPAGSAMRDLIRRLAVAEISTHPGETLDCDTWDDVVRARRILEES
jgi:molybdopterin-guanine dinucleotide biosynthesis protein A